MLKLLLVLAIVYLAVLVMTYVNQASLIYQRSNRGLTNAETDSLGLVKWPNTQDYRGYLVDSGSADKTFVLFHGNAGEAANRMHYLPPFNSRNARTLLVEYPGFGLREGAPNEALLVADAIETLTQLSAEFPSDPIIVLGESLGSGVASATVGALFHAHDEQQKALSAKIHGLGLITPFDSLVNVAQGRYWYLPVSLLIQDNYNSANNLRDVTIPKALVISGQDRVVPTKYGYSLEGQLAEKKRTFVLPTAGHSNWTDFVDAQWWDDYFDFLLQNTQNSDP